MIEFILLDDEADPDDGAVWGAVEDGTIQRVDDSLRHPTTNATFEEFVTFLKGTFEGITDPVSVTRRYDGPELVAGIPTEDGDRRLLAGDAHRFGEEGALGPFEAFEWAQYQNLDEIAENPDVRIDPRREHVVPDRYAIVQFSILEDGHLVEIGRIDTSTGAVLETDRSETAFERTLQRRFRGIDDCTDPAELLREFEGKTRNRVAVVDRETGDRLTDPRRVLPKPNHPEHPSVDRFEDPPIPGGARDPPTGDDGG